MDNFRFIRQKRDEGASAPMEIHSARPPLGAWARGTLPCRPATGSRGPTPLEASCRTAQGLESAEANRVAAPNGEEGHEARVQDDLGRPKGQKRLGARLGPGLAVLLVDVQRQTIDLLEDAGPKLPAVCGEGPTEQAGTGEGRIPPERVLVRRSIRQLLEREFLKGLGGLAVREAKKEARPSAQRSYATSLIGLLTAC